MQYCKYCRGVSVIIRGQWTELEIDNEHRIIGAYGNEGEAELEIKYCPMCGRKLGVNSID